MNVADLVITNLYSRLRSRICPNMSTVCVGNHHGHYFHKLAPGEEFHFDRTENA
jgi:hypothetical protein